MSTSPARRLGTDKNVCPTKYKMRLPFRARYSSENLHHKYRPAADHSRGRLCHTKRADTGVRPYESVAAVIPQLDGFVVALGFLGFEDGGLVFLSAFFF